MSNHKHTNKLINETSPYLLQHAHNPVNWYPWGDEAIERSRAEDKPILLSIGYSACHWCHVMEHESFEDEQIASLMNQNFISIKVDREERPDIDSIYMNAVQMMIGHGGWPLTVFLTPELKPFYGGTYFPPIDSRGLPGFTRILLAIADSYQTRKDDVAGSADAITDELRKANRFHGSAEMLTANVLDQAYVGLGRNFDSVEGGFGAAPKFPPSMSLMFLLRQHARTHTTAPLEMAELTLKKMAGGGMYDQLGGGFHRYSVDAHWLVPHFEKMLYDNALLARTYLYAYQATRNELYRRIAEETLDYVVRDLTDRSGGFYSSEDADSEGEEGKFYVWTKAEVLEILGPGDGEVVCDYFNVSGEGNFEGGASILNTPVSLEETALSHGIDSDQLRKTINAAKKRLFNARDKRVRPGRDDKILAAWNGLMLTAFAEAASILGRDDYRAIAERNANFILDSLCKNGRLLRTYKNGQAKLNGYIEDYAYVAEGLLALYEATFEEQYLHRARELADAMIEHFSDESDAGFFFTSNDHEQLITRMKEFFDNATPSGNSVASLTLLKLSLLTGDDKYQRPAIAVLRMMREAMERFPSAFGYMLGALDFYLSEPKEIAIIGDPSSHEVSNFLEIINSQFIPNKVLALAPDSRPADEASIPLLKDKAAVGGKPTVYVCRNYTCLAPAVTDEELAQRLAQ